MFNELLQHTFWQNTTIPSYDATQSHLPSGENPEDPSDWFDFFWPDPVLEYIVKESNIYIQNRNKKKNKNNNIKPTCINELKRFMGVCMFMSTFKLPSPRKYWTEKIPTVVRDFTANRFEQHRSSSHFSSQLDSAKTMEDLAKKIKPLIELINERLALLTISDQVCIDEMMIQSKSKFGPRIYQKGKPHQWGYKLCGLSDAFGLV